MATREEMIRDLMAADQQSLSANARPSREQMIKDLMGADERAPAQAQDGANDYVVAAERGVLQGARPFVAGVGGAIGNTIGRLERGGWEEPLADKLGGAVDALKSGFTDSRQAARAEESDLQSRRPWLTGVADVGGALLTAPLLAAKGAQAAAQVASKAPTGAGLLTRMATSVGNTGRMLGQGAGQAAKVGGLMGTTQALGHADSLGEAATMIGGGAILGGGSQVGLNAISKAAPAVWGAVKAGSKKVASGLTGVTEKEITTYASRANEVKKLIGDAGGSMSDAADAVREGITRDLQTTRQRLGSQIGQALKSEKYAATKVNGAPLLQKLDEALAKVGDVTARFRPDEINELKNLRDLVAQSMDETGGVGLQTLSQLKEELQAIAKPSYMNGAKIFPKGDLAASGAKGAAGEARRLLNAAAPEIKAANDQLRRLHLIEEGMNRNLIQVGKSEAALVSAGSGANPRNAKYLSAIDEITGGTAVRQAENLAAARSFGNPQLLPVDTTGKALARMATGGGVGTVLAGPIGGVIGTAATSPAALKAGLDIGRGVAKAASAVGRGVSGAMPEVSAGTSRAALAGAGVRGRASLRSVPIERVAELDRESSRSSNYQEKPLRGREKWVSDGFNRIANESPELAGMRDEMTADPKIRLMLMQASDLKPGSAALKKTLEQIRAEMGKRR